MLILVAITLHEKADERHIRTLQDVQVHNDKNNSTKAAGKCCSSSFDMPR